MWRLSRVETLIFISVVLITLAVALRWG